MRPRALLTRFLIVKQGPMGEALSSASAATAWPRRGTAAGAEALNGAPDPPESPRCPAEHHRARPELRRAPLCCLRSGPPVSMVIGPPERIERKWSCSALAALRRQSANSMAFGPPGGTTHARREAEVAGLNCNGSPRRVRRSSVLLVVRAVVNDGLTVRETTRSVTLILTLHLQSLRQTLLVLLTSASRRKRRGCNGRMGTARMLGTDREGFLWRTKPGCTHWSPRTQTRPTVGVQSAAVAALRGQTAWVFGEGWQSISPSPFYGLAGGGPALFLPGFEPQAGHEAV